MLNVFVVDGVVSCVGCGAVCVVSLTVVVGVVVV